MAWDETWRHTDLDHIKLSIRMFIKVKLEKSLATVVDCIHFYSLIFLFNVCERFSATSISNM